jgi:hypothetical protein
MAYKIKTNEARGIHSVHITSEDNEIVLLHISGDSGAQEIYIIHDSDGITRQITVPADSIDALILALQKIKESIKSISPADQTNEEIAEFVINEMSDTLG